MKLPLDFFLPMKRHDAVHSYPMSTPELVVQELAWRSFAAPRRPAPLVGKRLAIIVGVANGSSPSFVADVRHRLILVAEDAFRRRLETVLVAGTGAVLQPEPLDMPFAGRKPSTPNLLNRFSPAVGTLGPGLDRSDQCQRARIREPLTVWHTATPPRWVTAWACVKHCVHHGQRQSLPRHAPSRVPHTAHPARSVPSPFRADPVPGPASQPSFRASHA